MFCSNCGHNLAGNQGVFCPNCGAKVNEATAQATPTAAPQDQSQSRKAPLAYS